MSILITAANSAQAYQLKGILINETDIVLGDYLEIPDLMIKSGRMIKTPDPKSNSFIHEMLALCLDKGINKLYPLRKAELLPLAEARQLFTEFDIALYIPSIAVINRMNDEVTDGQIVIIANGKVEAGNTSDNNSFPIGDDMNGTGVFKINKQGYTIFTAD